MLIYTYFGLFGRTSCGKSLSKPVVLSIVLLVTVQLIFPPSCHISTSQPQTAPQWRPFPTSSGFSLCSCSVHGSNRFNQIKQLQLTWKETDFFLFPHDLVHLMPWLSNRHVSQKTPVGCMRSEKLVLVGKVFFHPVGLISFYKYYSIDRDQTDASQPTWWGLRCFVLLDVKVKLKIIWLSIWLHHFCSFFFFFKSV